MKFVPDQLNLPFSKRFYRPDAYFILHEMLCKTDTQEKTTPNTELGPLDEINNIFISLALCISMAIRIMLLVLDPFCLPPLLFFAVYFIFNRSMSKPGKSDHVN